MLTNAEGVKLPKIAEIRDGLGLTSIVLWKAPLLVMCAINNLKPLSPTT